MSLGLQDFLKVAVSKKRAERAFGEKQRTRFRKSGEKGECAFSSAFGNFATTSRFGKPLKSSLAFHKQGDRNAS
jgi:hypothetical protein